MSGSNLKMATSGKGLQGSLVGRFDEIVAGTNVLSSGIEQGRVFVDFYLDPLSVFFFF